MLRPEGPAGTKPVGRPGVFLESRPVPEHEPLYRHRQQGPDDMPAHVRAALTQTDLSIPVRGADRVLGTWQAIYRFEHRRAGQRRQVVAHLLTD